MSEARGAGHTRSLVLTYRVAVTRCARLLQHRKKSDSYRGTIYDIPRILGGSSLRFHTSRNKIRLLEMWLEQQAGKTISATKRADRVPERIPATVPPVVFGDNDGVYWVKFL